MKILMVGGKWDDHGGEESGYFKKLYSEMSCIFPCINYYNGGSYADLVMFFNPERLASKDVLTSNVIIWMPEISNEKEKFVEEIKNDNPTCILVTSKRNDNKKCSFMELVARALKIHSNIFIEFCKQDNIYKASIFDPLGNCFGADISSIQNLAFCLCKRISFLSGMQRCNSIGIYCDNILIPEDEEFFSLIKEYANIYHNLIHGANTDRLLGNASFRCERGGFPSFRKDGKIFVSKRNIDKRDIGRNGFVKVEQDNIEDRIYYYGKEKPSVDAPIQVRLYNLYPNINYMLHSHVYVDNALMTKNIIPCGALNEVLEILELYPDREISKFSINLKGHGSIVFGNKVDDLKNINYVARVVPEIE